MNDTQKPLTTNRLKCPACATAIRETEPLSSPERVYRCPVCRLDFVREPDTHTLTLAPLTSSSLDAPTQELPTDESRNPAFVIEHPAAPSNLIRERVPVQLSRAAAEERPPVRPRKAVVPVPPRPKRLPGT